MNPWWITYAGTFVSPRSFPRFNRVPLLTARTRPGLRERLTISEDNILTNRFWYSFAHNFRFIWPHSPLQAVEVNPSTSCYQLSTDFQTCMQDIGRYRMKSQFFTQFPQLHEDIGPADLLLMSVKPSPTNEFDPRPQAQAQAQDRAQAQAQAQAREQEKAEGVSASATIAF